MFTCKQFIVEDSQCAMKVSTDALILGSWCETKNAKRILDIGCGSGILALMLLQKSFALVHAVDIDKSAVEQTIANFERSPWNNRVNVFHSDVATFTSDPYDLLICNPPYFSESKTKANANMQMQRRVARHQTQLDCEQIFSSTKRLALANARLVLMYPYELTNTVIDIASKHGWLLSTMQSVQHNAASLPYLTLFEFSRTASTVINKPEVLVIRQQQDYSAQFKQLCRDYYLRF